MPEIILVLPKIFAVFSHLKPLQNLLFRTAVFHFDSKCHDAFYSLKEKLVTAPVLAIYSPLKDTELHVDASALGFGAALMQRQEDRKFHPVAYFSKTASVAESKYHSFELDTWYYIRLTKYSCILLGNSV